ncbi:MAG TPA: hypothetical protein ENN99_04415 [Chloroflexi bacterium]|nr:hypothetical protein [Chloroflexota bacterium]
MTVWSPDQIAAFRYWIQGYPNFYEPIVEEYFRVAGYRVLRRPALVGRADIQRVVNALFDGHKRLGPALDETAIRRHLEGRSRLQPDFLLDRQGKRYLAELKSWGGSRSGQFDLDTARAEFVANFKNGLFFLVDRVEGADVAGKLLVVSSRSPEHERVLALLRDAYRTKLELLYLDEIFFTPQLAGVIDRQLHYLDAAVAELRQALKGP